MPLCDRCQALIVAIPSLTHAEFRDLELQSYTTPSSTRSLPGSCESSVRKNPYIDNISPSNIQIPSASIPRNWPPLKKALIACFVLLAAFTATIGTPLYVAAIHAIQYQFHLSTTMAILPSSLYALSLGLGALLATSFCELYGRRIIFRLTLPIALLFTVLASTAPTFAYLAIAKMFAGLFSGPCLTVGVGTINDLWDVSLDYTGSIFAVLFVVVAILATQIGPMTSASVIERGWEWTFHVSSILLIFCVVATFMIPETYIPAIQHRVAVNRGYRMPSRANMDNFLLGVGRPLQMMVEPIVFPTGLVMAITQSVVFAYYVAYAALFEGVYGFSQYQVGMAFSPLLVGTCSAIPVIMAFDKLTYQPARSEARRNGTIVAPEKRLYPAMLGSITLPTSLFWLAWSGKKEIHWIVPVLSGTLFGFSYVLNMLCLPIYNNDVYSTHYGASVLAASTFLRFVISSSFLLVTSDIIKKLGFAWAVSVLGFVTVALIPIPFVAYRWGPKLRAKSRYLQVKEI